MGKLTKAQLRELRYIERMGDMGSQYADWYKPVQALHKSGLVNERDTQQGFRVYIITPAGRAALEQINEPHRIDIPMGPLETPPPQDWQIIKPGQT